MSNIFEWFCIDNFFRTTEKIPMNLLPKQLDPQPPNQVQTIAEGDVLSGLDLRFLTGELNKKSDIKNGDDCMVDISDDKSDDSKLCISVEKDNLVSVPQDKEPDKIIPTKIDIKPMNDINVKLESIKPSSIPPLTVLEEKNGISVTLHFAKDKPRDDVQVVVVTTISKNSLPLSNYLFQSVVPKVCTFRERHTNFLLILLFFRRVN